MSQSTYLINLAGNAEAILGKIASAQDKVETKFGKLATMAGNFNQTLFAIGNAASVFDSLSNKAGQYSDALADVRKTTGLSEEGAQKLDDQLKQIDTRTGMLGLLDMARVAGEFGQKSPADIEKFVRAANMANVAIGDHFGNSAEETARRVGTLKNLFAGVSNMPVDEAMIRISSVMNHLGNTMGTNSMNIQEFTQRMGQLGAMGPSLTQNMAIGAVLEKAGIDAAIASGGLTNFFLNAAKESKVFAKQLGLSTSEFEKMLNTNPNKVLIDLAESMKKASSVDVVKTLDKMSIAGSQETLKVFQTLASKMDVVRKTQIETANAFATGNSVLEEYNLKENTLQARLDKSRKMFDQYAVSIGTALGPYLPLINASAMLAMTFTSLWPLFKLMGTGFIWLFNGIKAVTAGTWTFNAALWANPVTWVVAGVIALIAAVALLVIYWDEITAALKPFADWMLKLVDDIFPGFEKVARETIQKVATWFTELWGTVKPVWDGLMTALGFGGGGTVEASVAAKDAAKLNPATDQNIQQSIFGAGNAGSGGYVSPLADDKDTKKNLDGITGGGAKATNITINIERLNERIEVRTTNLRESPDEIERIMTELLLRAVNGANQASYG